MKCVKTQDEANALSLTQIIKRLDSFVKEMLFSKERLSEEAALLLQQFNEGTTPEGLVCQLADIISVVLYAHDEMSVGNKNFEIIAKKALIRVNDVLSKLTPHINANYTNDQIIEKINKIIYI
jgi:hypothetical protein